LRGQEDGDLNIVEAADVQRALKVISFYHTDRAAFLPITHPAENILTMLNQIARAQSMFSAQVMFSAEPFRDERAHHQIINCEGSTGIGFTLYVCPALPLP
jgi:hypothetical protein